MTTHVPGSYVVIGYFEAEDSWHAVWGDDRLLGEFDGDREAAISWARGRSDLILVWSAEVEDYLPYP